MLGTNELKSSKLAHRVMKVKVDEKVVEETKDEKLLGILMSNNLSWNSYLYGNKLTGKDKIIGLIPKLSQRVGILGKLNKYMTREQSKLTCDGIFNSCLLYCLPLFCYAWGLPFMDVVSSKFSRTKP